METEKIPAQVHARDNGLDGAYNQRNERSKLRRTIAAVHVPLMVLLLLFNYFIAQYDKFVLSYFQTDVIRSLHLTSTQYGLLSGYATGIVSALTAIPIAFVADYSGKRVWTLTVAALWWNVCVILQGYSHNFWQIFLARLAMSIGQSPVEALSISVISDLVPVKWLFLAESILYVGVYIGEAVSAQIATAFVKTGTPWNDALRAIGITGLVLIVLLRFVVREPARRNLVAQLDVVEVDNDRPQLPVRRTSLLTASVKQIVRMKSFWMLTLSSGARQFSGNVFGWYMPSYLSSLYPSKPDLLSHYGIIVGAVGSVAVLLGGIVCSSVPRRPATALYLTAIGGMISAAFVICMVFSRKAGASEDVGVSILYGTMSAAYITAELWLGAFASLLALLLPPEIKTVCLSIYTCTIILIYSWSAPEIIGLALRNDKIGSHAYIDATRDILAALIPIGYWVAGVGFLLAIPYVRQDIVARQHSQGVTNEPISKWRIAAFALFVGFMSCLTIALLVTSLVGPVKD